MAHNLDKHYNDFGGLDVSPSLLVQSAKTVRKGSKNFRWNYNDQLQNREGFQHKTAQSNAAEAGLIEYKFKDINTGESKTEILGVSFDGKLRKRLIDRLKLSVTAASTVYYYSFFYDATATNYKIVFYNSAQVVLASSTVTIALTLEALKIIINAFGIAGLSADVVDESGASKVSSNLAYLMDVVWLEEFNKTPTFTDIEYNEVWYWTEIYTPDGNPAFVNAADPVIQNSQDYEGIFYVNQNNSVYITDGGFPFKYDGKSLYRAGLPKIYETGAPLLTTSSIVTISNSSPAILTVSTTLGYYFGMPFQLATTGVLPTGLALATTYYVSAIVSPTTIKCAASFGGIDINTSSAGSGIHTLTASSSESARTYSGQGLTTVQPQIPGLYWQPGDHGIKFQYVFKDPTGVIIYGKVQPTFSFLLPDTNGYCVVSPTATNDEVLLNVGRIVNDGQFPVYSVKNDEAAPVIFSGVGPHTMKVVAGHNLKVGMALRFYGDTNNNVSYLEIIAIDTGLNTITFNGSTTLVSTTIPVGQLFNACYVPVAVLGRKVAPKFNNGGYPFPQDIPYGASLQMYATRVSTSIYTNPGPFYKTPKYFQVPRLSSEEYTIGTFVLDNELFVEYNGESEGGEDLGRSCRYLNIWQNQIAQAGRPYDPTVSTDPYPSVYNYASYITLNDSIEAYYYFTYSEVHLCDFQSVYWASFLYPEGFPQSGLNEESFESKFNDRITGIFPNKDALFAFKQRTTGYLTGTLATGDIVKEILEADVGCATQQSIQEVRGSLVFMDENLGFWNVVAGRLPVFMGYQIQTYFKENKIQPRNLFLNFRRAKSVNFRALDQYICYVPAGKKEDGEDAPISDPTSGSIAFVFDYGDDIGKPKSMWMAFQEINAAGGMLFSADSELIISEKQALNNRLWKQKFTGSIYDYSDHDQPIEFNYKGAFLTMGHPVIDKSFQRVILSSVLGGFSVVINQFANFIDTIVGSYQLTFGTTGRTTVKLDVKANIEKLSGLSFGFYANEINQAIKIDGWEVEYSAPFDVGEPKK
jgi:hypothetical protein